MDKTIVGLIGAISALASLDAAQAAPMALPNLAEVMHVDSYEDLLKPIPNSVALLRADNAARAQTSDAKPEGEVELVQYHDHHHHHWRRWRHHHHHYRHHHHHHWD